MKLKLTKAELGYLQHAVSHRIVTLRDEIARMDGAVERKEGCVDIARLQRLLSNLCEVGYERQHRN